MTWSRRELDSTLNVTYSLGRLEARLLWSYKAAALTAYVPAAPSSA